MRTLAILIVVLTGIAVGCRGPLSVFGYTTEPPFDPNIRSVYLPTFKLNAFVTTPDHNLDREITEAVVRELSARKSPMRVLSDRDRADTELIGTVLQVSKTVQNRNQQNLTREAEVTLVVEVLWRDLRSGDVLTNPKKRTNPVAPPSTFDPSRDQPPPEAPNDAVRPVQIVATGRAVVEVGESNVTANQMAIKKLATQIVNMMERNW